MKKEWKCGTKEQDKISRDKLNGHVCPEVTKDIQILIWYNILIYKKVWYPPTP